MEDEQQRIVSLLKKKCIRRILNSQIHRARFIIKIKTKFNQLICQTTVEQFAKRIVLILYIKNKKLLKNFLVIIREKKK